MSERRWLRSLAPLILLAGIGACQPNDDAALEETACDVAEAPSFAVGGLEPPEHVFGQVVDATRLSDGRIAVVDRQARSVAVFSAAGELLSQLGREGEGPGEFLDPIGIDHAGDTIAVWDWEQIRVTEFDLASGAVETAPMQGMLNPTHHFGYYENGFVLGSILVEEMPPTGLSPRILRVLHFSPGDAPSGAPVDTIAQFTRSMAGWVDQEARFAGFPTFSPRGTFTVTPTGVAWTTGESAVIHRVSGSDTTRLTWEWPSRPVTDEDFETYREQRIGQAPETMQPMLEKQYATMPVAEVFPVARDLLPDREESVWVEIYPTPGDSLQTWLRVTEAGVDCRLRLPSSFELVEGSPSWFLGYDEDDLGVQTVQLWSLVR